ncbi:hypothetical protein IC582_022551 [Cucumis melo]|uniref:FK506-binding protein 4-like n=3 Tax=Cucumis melo TaxID=3656 RepID=A0A1S3ATX5_CUCME|nr:heavy metal-associated isoprenylated plant protein 39-like [Cucumis melo]ADN33773.1 metal ion binding protein [Cucumis melo subsp. melo]KAA0042592.1 FK506-binding protein 4-like [Cucumis melo var. makuwa]TYK05995.1 FK506-binding protein 4-like [Cucumis melo var. makuwa]
MKKVIVKLDVSDEKSKQKAMSVVSSLSGVNSISMDMKEKKLTVTGDVDPVVIVSKLRKICHTTIVSVGPEKEEKKPEPKKDEPKKEDPKKVAEEKKKEEQRLAEFIKACQAYNLYNNPPPVFYPPRSISIEEDPNGCVIC